MTTFGPHGLQATSQERHLLAVVRVVRVPHRRGAKAVMKPPPMGKIHVVPSNPAAAQSMGQIPDRLPAFIIPAAVHKRPVPTRA